MSFTSTLTLLGFKSVSVESGRMAASFNTLTREDFGTGNVVKITREESFTVRELRGLLSDMKAEQQAGASEDRAASLTQQIQMIHDAVAAIRETRSRLSLASSSRDFGAPVAAVA